MGKKPIADEDIRKLNGVMRKYPRAKKEGDKFYSARICEIAGTRRYCVRTLQAIRHVDGDPDKYREYTEKRRAKFKEENKPTVQPVDEDEYAAEDVTAVDPHDREFRLAVINALCFLIENEDLDGPTRHKKKINILNNLERIFIKEGYR